MNKVIKSLLMEILLELSLADEFYNKLNSFETEAEKEEWCVEEIRKNSVFSSLAYEWLRNKYAPLISSLVRRQAAAKGWQPRSFEYEQLRDKAWDIFNDCILNLWNPRRGSLSAHLSVYINSGLKREAQKIVATAVEPLEFYGEPKDIEKEIEVSVPGVSIDYVVLKKELEELEPELKRILELYLQGYDVRSIARILGKKRSWVFDKIEDIRNITKQQRHKFKELQKIVRHFEKKLKSDKAYYKNPLID